MEKKQQSIQSQPQEELARKVLLLEQRTGHANTAVKPGGLAAFFASWSQNARNEGMVATEVERLVGMFAAYATLDPMQRAASVRAALAILGNMPQPAQVGPQAPIAPSHPPQARPSPSVATAPPTPANGHVPVAAVHPAGPPAGPPKGAPAAVNGVSVRTAVKKSAPAHTGPVGEYLLDAPVTSVPGVGPTMMEKLERLGIRTVRDLLYFLPRDHHDYSALAKIASLPFDEVVTVLGVIWEVENVRTGKSKVVRTVARISDETDQIRVVWFNQPYLQKQLPRGAQIVVTGVKQRFGNAVQLTAKSHELPEQGDLINTGRLVPVYPLTEGLSAKTLRRATKWCVDRCAGLVSDYLPPSVRQSAHLIPLPRALGEYHYPENGAMLVAARERLAFDELFIVQLGMIARRANWHAGPPAPRIAVDRSRILTGVPATSTAAPAFTPTLPGLWGGLAATATCFEESLPFRFTDAQRRVIGEVLDDIARAQPMCRLIQGDVGSGKTAVAAAAMLAAALNGIQSAIMAPTEILAEQHARGLAKMLEPFGVEVVSLLGSQRAKQRAESLDAIATGRALVVVGTHALIQEGVVFARLGLAVVDEQHRFGVEQREELRRKGGESSPHLLLMTATPIPRTLALAVYGDLDLSVIDQMPRGRRPIITRWRAGSRRDEAYDLMAREVAAGRQGYIICPLIEESRNTGGQSGGRGI